MGKKEDRLCDNGYVDSYTGDPSSDFSASQKFILSKQVPVYAIVAMSSGRVIGHNGSIPWHIPEDMKRFKELTTGHTVVMGRKTYESLPERFRPLPDRKNIVMSQAEDLFMHPEVQVISSFDDYVDEVQAGSVEIHGEILWVIGGSQVYEATLPLWDEIYLTFVSGDYPGDVFFPHFEHEFEEIDREEKDGYAFVRYRRP